METSGPVEIFHPTGGQFPTLTCRYANGTLLHFVEQVTLFLARGAALGLGEWRLLNGHGLTSTLYGVLES
jgi:hypothetical protein